MTKKASTNIISYIRKIALRASYAAVFCAFALFVEVSPVRAQFIGYTSPQTVSFTGTISTCNGIAQTLTVPNLGQSVHFLSYVATGAPTTLRVYIVGIGATTTQQISDTGTDISAAGGIITANGYYSQVTLNVACTGGSSPTILLSYFGTSANSVPTTGIQDQGAWLKTVATAAVENTTQTFAAFTAPYGNSCGRLFFVPNQGSNSGTLTVGSTGVSGVTLATFTPSAAFATSVFEVPCLPAQGISVTYTVVSGNAGTYALYYVFYKQGFLPNLQTPNSGTSATLPIQVVSDQLSQAFALSASINTAASSSMNGFNLNNASGKSIYLDKAILSASASGELDINLTNAVGSLCGSGSGIANLKTGASPVSIVTAQVGCSTPQSTSINLARILVGANSPVVIDLKGLILSGGTNGLSIIAVSGVTTGDTTLFWYEK